MSQLTLNQGVNIYDQRKSLGKTPLFHKVKSQPELTFTADLNDPQSTHNFPCQIQWLRLSLENLLSLSSL